MKIISFIVLICIHTSLQAEIFKQSGPCNNGDEICEVWWPKLKPVPGWQQDSRHSYYFRSNAQTPVNIDFAKAEAVIYAKAIKVTDKIKTKTLKEFIEHDKKSFLNKNANLRVINDGELRDKSGRIFYGFSFVAQDTGNWEKVSYSEEVEEDGTRYYLLFVLSSRSRDAYISALNAYNQFITTYQ